MSRSRLTYLIFFFLFLNPALHAEIFVVININNTGAGSLRDAIERANANGTAETDYIYFDIPARARDKTIYLRPTDLLPPLSSNIVIDGTTQPGDRLGVSDAKTTITIEGAYGGTDPIYLFNITQASNISIYGIKMVSAVIDRATNQPPADLFAIYMLAASNIIVGELGKGNVIVGWNKAVYNHYDGRFGYSGNISIQSNYFGIDSDGITIEIGGRTGSGPATNISGVYIEKAKGPVRVGGNADEETNYFNSASEDVFVEGEYNEGTDSGVTIINNRFGIGYRNINLNSITTRGIYLKNMSTRLAGFPPILISRNHFGGLSRNVGIEVWKMAPRFLINQNIIGYEENGQVPRNSNYGVGILLLNCTNAIVGGDGGGLENIIRYQRYAAIVCDTTRDISIFQNSTYCNAKRAIVLDHWEILNTGRPKPFVTINRIDGFFGMISGKAPRLSTIELFNDDNCPGCEGKTFFARTTSDVNGNWTYRGTFTGTNIIATASDQGNATSEYSKPEIDTSALISPTVICNSQLASICGLKIVSGTNWQWEDANGNVLGTDTCLNNVGAGTYFLRLSIGTQSCEERFRFVVKDSVIGIDSSNRVTIGHNRCGKSNGYIRGFIPVNASRWQWEDINGNIISTDIELRNVPSGRYRFRVFNRACDIVTGYYEITDISPRIDAANIQIISTTCGLNNGRINGITATGTSYSSIQWKDESGNIVGNVLNLLNIAPGRYKLVLLDAAEGCGDSTGYFTVPAIAAPALNIANATITHTTCDQSNGSINGIVSANTIAPVVFVWVNETNNIVGNALTLSNVPAGRYRLKMKDGSSCDTVFSSVFEVLSNGAVALDESTVIVKPTGCTTINGSVTGINVAGANLVQWINTSNNTVVSTNPTLLNMPAGNYRLEISNTISGCTKTSRAYTIGTADPIPLNVTQTNTKDATCNTNNGSISITGFDNNQNWFSFTWLRDSIQAISNNIRISNLSPAVYHLIATDTNGCKKAIYKRNIIMLPLPVLDESNVVVSNDTCAFNTGAINGIVATSDQGNLSYQWFNGTSAVNGSNKILRSVGRGDYQLTITDVNGCKATSRVYTVNEVITALPTPRFDDISIPRHASATLRVKNRIEGASYELLDSRTGLAIQNNNSGTFNISDVKEDMILFIRASAGSCVSAVGQVNIKVIDVTQLEIPNAFTPNGDGINDQFKIRVTGYFKLDGLKIFNRWGQLVFETRDLSNEWNGTIRGNPLAIGTYYWVMEGLDVEGKRLRKSGSVTLLR